MITLITIPSSSSSSSSYAFLVLFLYYGVIINGTREAHFFSLIFFLWGLTWAPRKINWSKCDPSGWPSSLTLFFILYSPRKNNWSRCAPYGWLSSLTLCNTGTWTSAGHFPTSLCPCVCVCVCVCVCYIVISRVCVCARARVFGTVRVPVWDRSIIFIIVIILCIFSTFFILRCDH